MVFLVTCIFSLFCFEGAIFSGLHFYTLSKTLIACRDIAQILKSENIVKLCL